MKKNKLLVIWAMMIVVSLLQVACNASKKETSSKASVTVVPFGEGGQLKMIYDRRQRPQAIYVNDQVYMVYNGGSHLKGGNGRKTFPFVISYDPTTKSLGDPIQLGTKPSGDQHYCPIIWSDKDDRLHILYGCHKTPGTHLISNEGSSIGTSAEDWTESSMIRNSLSYPTIYHIYDNKQLIHFRTGEHRSSWSYLISGDNGNTWTGPETDVTDLNLGDELKQFDDPMDMNEMSCYQTVLPSKDGKFLHVAFCSYDDNKKDLPEKFYNPRYNSRENFGFKYNLYYAKVNLQTQEVVNFEGEKIKTPIDIETALSKCLIWDTDWRGAGVPPDIILDENENPAFLHVLSGDTPDEYNYHFVRYEDGEWKPTLIAPSSDDWNSCYLRLGKDGTLYACMIMGEAFYKKGDGDMHSRGGGDVEEWISTDKGKSWSKHRDLTPRAPEFSGWKFNNVQPIKDVNGTVVPGMLLYYGWKDPELRSAKAFLVVDD